MKPHPLSSSSSRRPAGAARLAKPAPLFTPTSRLGQAAGRVVERPLRLLWRNFWLVSVTAVLLCAVFAAQAAAHLVEASFSPLAPSEPTHPDVAPRAIALPPPPPVPAAAPPAVSYAPLPRPVLSLLATHVSDDPSRSFASLIEPSTRFSGGYLVGDRVPGGGVLASVHYQYVEIDYAGQVERLAFTSDADPASSNSSANSSPSAPSTPLATLTEEERAIAEGTRKVSDDHYEADRALVEQVMANPMGFLKKVRAVPAIVDGKPVGIKVYAITPNSLPAKLGLANGDTLQVINGFSLTSASAGLDAYAQLREATSLELSLTRRGKPLSLKVSIR